MRNQSRNGKKKKPKPKPAGPKKMPIINSGKSILNRPTGVPDLVRQDKLTSLLAPPKIRLGGRSSGEIKAILAGQTTAQQALELCETWYKRLTEENPRLLHAVTAMLSFRRAYAVAYRELNEAIDEAQNELNGNEKQETIPVELADFAVQYAMWQASKPFTEHELMDGVMNTVLPWLTDVIDRHSDADDRAADEEKALMNEERRATPVPIGFKHTPYQEDATLSRDKSLVLVGWRNAVLWLYDQIAEEVLKCNEWPFSIVRMMKTPPKVRDQQARYVKLAPNTWTGCANSDTAIDLMVGRHVVPSVSGPIDLVMCDDLSLAHDRGFIGRPEAAQAGDAHKRLRKWCDVMSSALIGAVPTDTKVLPDFSGNEFEQLKTFTLLRPVDVQDGEDGNYRITIGTSAAVFDVPRDVLDGYGSTLLIVPSSI